MSIEIPAFPILLLAPVAEALESSDPASRAEAFARMAEEALALAKDASTPELFWFWGRLHEDFHSRACELREPAKPKRRWFR